MEILCCSAEDMNEAIFDQSLVSPLLAFFSADEINVLLSNLVIEVLANLLQAEPAKVRCSALQLPSSRPFCLSVVSHSERIDGNDAVTASFVARRLVQTPREWFYWQFSRTHLVHGSGRERPAGLHCGQWCG